MRPVTKQAAPRVYAAFEDAKRDLTGQIGPYCSYCERTIPTHLAVEHVLPQEHNTGLSLDWNNFLLACVNCNSCKGHDNIALIDFLWPHLDNTYRALDWTGGLVQAVQGTPMSQKASSTVRLVGLDIDPGNPDPTRRPDHPTRSDGRFDARFEMWASAKRSRDRLGRNPSDELRDEIAERAADVGMFSIWMKVFENDQDMRLRLIAAFTGTAANCFDATGLPVPRPGGQC